MKRFSANHLALLILVIAYIVSAFRFFSIAGYVGSGSEDGQVDEDKVIRVAHWQLEHGYREALDWAIAQYNELPQVKEAGIRVEQSAITERVYNQFMNVHLISGTAPDIAAKGQTQLVKGNAVARYYSPLGEYINDPNPYNAPEYMGDVDPDLAKYLAEAPWKDTFIDGMLGGYDEGLDDYYAIPISTWGGIRLFYNVTILENVKEFLNEAMHAEAQPKWLADCWLRTDEEGQTQGFLPDNERLREWVVKEAVPPETLGQLMLYCEAVLAYASAENLPYLVPVSGSNYSITNLAHVYEDMFLSDYVEELEGEFGTGINSFEAFVGWDAGVWDFYSKPVRESLRFANIVSRYYPPGFLGLDREQAQRRFVMGKAALISTGGWDASGIFSGVENRDNPEDVFEVTIKPAPLPARDERWADLIEYRSSEADTKVGVPLAINKQSKNFDWALDFLKFITSKPINEEINERAAWLSAIVGADNREEMKPFISIAEGIPPDDNLNVRDIGGPVRSYWSGQAKLYMVGDLSYDEFVERVEAFLDSPLQGMNALWIRRHQSTKDSSRATGRSECVEAYAQLFTDDSAKAAERERSLFFASLSVDEAIQIERLWKQVHPGEPFPEF